MQSRRGPSLLWFGIGFLLALNLGACDTTRFRVRTPPGTQLDVFGQASVPTVDILWVVDNSASMTEEQQALADSFSYFYQYLDTTGADFHIGVISTDVYSVDQRGKLLGQVPIISRATPQTAEVFSENIHVGTAGKGDEQGFKAAVTALSEPLLSTTNAGFLRDNAYLFVIFVSDEDDHSFGEVEYYTRKFEQIKGVGNDGMVNVAAVVGDVPDGCETAKAGTRYSGLAMSSSGLVASICQKDFSQNLDELGFAAAGLKRHFPLSRPAAPESIVVYIKTTCSASALPDVVCQQSFDDCQGTGEDIYGHACVVQASATDGFSYEPVSNSLVFSGLAVPPFGSIIEAGYLPQTEAP